MLLLRHIYWRRKGLQYEFFSGKRSIKPVPSNMKKPVSVTVEKELLLEVKAYAAERKISVSKLVESHFRQLIRPDKLSK